MIFKALMQKLQNLTIKVTYQIINFVKYYEIYYGRGSYAVITIKDYEKLTATKALFDELKKGESLHINVIN